MDEKRKTVEVEVEKVLELSKKCPQWADGLKTLFPDVFKKDIRVGDVRLEDWEDGVMLFYKRDFILFINENGFHRMPLSLFSANEIPMKFDHDVVGYKVRIDPD